MAKASIGKRVIAYFIDVILLMAVIMVFSAGGPIVFGLIISILKVKALTTILGLMIPLVVLCGVLLGAVYFLLKDGMFGGRSLGKKLVGLKVVTKEGSACTYMKSLIRNITLCVPLLQWIDLLMPVIDKEGLRIGDKIAGTKVIE